MSSTNEVELLRKDVRELEQMNGSLLDRIASLERDLRRAQAETYEANARADTERQLRRAEADAHEAKARAYAGHVECSAQQADLHTALLELERLEGLLRGETERRMELESELASQGKIETESSTVTQRDVQELECMNAELADMNSALKLENQKLLKMVGPLNPQTDNVQPLEEPELSDTQLLNLMNLKKDNIL